jgi:hypothetical protein
MVNVLSNAEPLINIAFDSFSDTFNMGTKLPWESGYSIVFPIWKKLAENPSPSEEMKFTQKFITGYENRASVRKGKPPGTLPDPMVDVIISAKLPSADLHNMSFCHRLSMSAENILGSVLEEYIHVKVIPYDWSCCWGSSVKSVDFCSSSGNLYQIKNRSNSENSSSSAIRDGTDIKKWFRIDARTGKTNWDALSATIGKPGLFSEEDFAKFCKNLILMNPSIIYIEQY